MSLPMPIEVSCRGCGAREPFTAWQTLNVTLNPAEKQKLLRGELMRFTCGKCGRAETVEYPLLYHDMAKGLMFWLWPGEGEPAAEAMPEFGVVENYCCRVAASLNDLLEKILIFDAGLDDRVVEVVKVMMRMHAGTNVDLQKGRLLFSAVARPGVGEEGTEPELVFQYGVNGKPVPACVRLSLYERTKGPLAGRLAELRSEAPKWVRVDQRYALKLLA